MRKPGAFDDPRIHMAANCASIGCPMLRKEAYVGARLDAQLDDHVRRFLSDRTRNRYSASSNALEVSSIFKWYAEDFTPAHAPSLIAYINRYLADPIPEDYALQFSDYDWTIANSRRQDRPAGTALAD